MKKHLSLLALLLSLSAFSQQYLTREATLRFDAGSPVEDIQATSESASAVYDADKGSLGVQVLMTSFQFKRALMQEHFNENYVESEKFPKAQFRGLYSDGRAKGELTIHGVTQNVDVPASLEIKNGEATLKATFKVILSDYNVVIPSAVADKISKEAAIEVNAVMKPRA
jgi:polyisoprenoid-binding protein YceI